MTAPKLLTVNLPFPGFYESAYSEAVDHEESSWLEYATENNGETDEDYESAWPEPLRLSNELGDLLYRHSRYSVAYESIARAYVDAVDHVAGEALEMSRPDTRQKWALDDAGQYVVTPEPYARPSLRMTFESMDSPREYNFSTDRVYGRIPLKVMRELFKRSAAEGHETLSRVIARRFTSYDGFRSYYPSDLAEWLAKAGRLQDWDHNELGTLLLAALEMSGLDMDGGCYDYDSFAGQVFDLVAGSDGVHSEWSNCVDWPAFDAARLEARAEKLTDWMESDPDAAKAWIRENGERAAALAAAEGGPDLSDDSVTVRCPWTPDMFAGSEAVQ